MRHNSKLAENMLLAEKLQRIENQKQIALKKQSARKKQSALKNNENKRVWEIIKRNERILRDKQAQEVRNIVFNTRNPFLSIMASQPVNNRSRPPSPGINRGRNTLRSSLRGRNTLRSSLRGSSVNYNNGNAGNAGNVGNAGNANTLHAKHSGNQSRKNPLHINLAGRNKSSRSHKGTRSIRSTVL